MDDRKKLAGSIPYLKARRHGTYRENITIFDNGYLKTDTTKGG